MKRLNLLRRLKMSQEIGSEEETEISPGSYLPLKADYFCFNFAHIVVSSCGCGWTDKANAGSNQSASLFDRMACQLYWITTV